MEKISFLKKRKVKIGLVILLLIVFSCFFIYWKIVKKEKEPLRVSIVTDIDHCPSRSSVPEELINEFIDFSKEKNVDFVVSLGDNASHRLGDCSKTADQDARFIVEKLKTTNKPCYFVLGDHDIGSRVSSYQAWLETIGRDKTYFSFDFSGVHVVVLDSVLGGEALSPPCEEVESCSKIKKRREDLFSLEFSEYRNTYSDSLEDQKEEKKKLKNFLREEEDAIKVTRSSGRRDRGRVSQTELDWLKYDILKTKKEKILVFSDHPLFPFASERKSYDILNGEKVREIFEQSEKQVVCISGEAHLWHEENINGVQYYIVDEFRNAKGSWAQFVWDENGYRFERVTHSN